jgi:hypothetical protein
VVTANLTPTEGTWMSQASKEEFIGRFRSWLDMPDNIKMAKGRNTIMPWPSYAGMTDEDLGAIYDYLKTVKPVPGLINSFPDDEAVAAR